jgi:peptide-methionine (S)-S-oxide reductase
MEKATFAAGCFWGVEESFRSLAGVLSTRVGYCGGQTDQPTYRDVCRGDTGHAEALEISFDPALISYQQLLEHFWNSHDPTQLNRQGPDIGSQYRSVIFYHSEEQRLAAEESADRLERSGRLRQPLVTSIQPAARFWEAEEYHQKYNLKHSRRCGL